nr:hypothetical protein [Tanacetum cinerariifolium]
MNNLTDIIDDQAIQTILLGLPEDIYAAIDSCKTAQEILLRVQQMMKGSDIRIQEKKAKLFNEWERFTSNERESIESYYHRFLKLMNDLKRNKHFPEKIASNMKFLNNLQPEWRQNARNLAGYNEVIGNQDWSYTENDREDHALVADEEAPIEFALMANTSTESKLMEAIEKRFGGNAATKKTQRNLLKQQYENFTASNSEMLDQTFDRLQNLNTYVVVWRNKADLDTMSMDDLYNNLKVYELEVKGMSSSNSSTQNMDFVSSSNNNNTNEVVNIAQAVNSALGVSTSDTQVNTANIDNLSDVVICEFLASQ